MYDDIETASSILKTYTRKDLGGAVHLRLSGHYPGSIIWYQTLTAESVEDALRKLSNDPYDYAVTAEGEDGDSETFLIKGIGEIY